MRACKMAVDNMAFLIAFFRITAGAMFFPQHQKTPTSLMKGERILPERAWLVAVMNGSAVRLIFHGAGSWSIRRADPNLVKRNSCPDPGVAAGAGVRRRRAADR